MMAVRQPRGHGEEGKRVTEKSGRKFESVGVQMDGAGMQGIQGKLIKMEARLMFVGVILMHSRGDTTPSSLLPFLAAHL